jgi:alkanesulfonate monooxygenase SsuD/methylene tetrahydromethanopterin reductase-like flavin-dependent oxidoreductase (luciferase family)
VGDGYITTSGKAPELYTGTLLPAVREGAGKAGRDVTDIDMMIEVKVSFDRDGDAAMHATRFWGALGLTQEQKAGVEDSVEMQRLADDLSVEQTARRFIVSTDPDEHVSSPAQVHHLAGGGRERLDRGTGAGGALVGERPHRPASAAAATSMIAATMFG